jgi:hypothetical protein
MRRWRYGRLDDSHWLTPRGRITTCHRSAVIVAIHLRQDSDHRNIAKADSTKGRTNRRPKNWSKTDLNSRPRI